MLALPGPRIKRYLALPSAAEIHSPPAAMPSFASPGEQRGRRCAGYASDGIAGQVLFWCSDVPQAVAKPAQALSAAGTSRKYTPTAAM